MIALLLVLAATPTSATSCEVMCSNQANRCYSTCDGLAKCTTRCGSRQESCMLSCEADRAAKREAKREKKGLPCEVSSSGAPRPCSAKEKAELKKAMASREAKSMCRDASGNLTACEAELHYAQAQYAALVEKCRKKKSAECRALDVQ